jgi:hypothetical protein
MASFFKTRNVGADLHESSMRDATPIPPMPADESQGMRLAPELVAFQIEQQRQAEQQAQPAPATPTLADAAVRNLRALLVACADQEAGRALQPASLQALGDFSRILATAQARGLGLSTEFTTRAG